MSDSKRKIILEIMFAYNFNEMYPICQDPDLKSRLIMTVTNFAEIFGEVKTPSLGILKKIVSPQSEGLRYPEHLCSPGLGAGASTSTKPPISAAAEMSGFCILYVQMHCLHRYNQYDKGLHLRNPQEVAKYQREISNAMLTYGFGVPIIKIYPYIFVYEA